MRAWWVWVAILALLVAAGVIVFLGGKRRRDVTSDPKAQVMVTVAILIAAFAPPIGWAIGYFSAGLNCV